MYLKIRIAEVEAEAKADVGAIAVKVGDEMFARVTHLTTFKKKPTLLCWQTPRTACNGAASDASGAGDGEIFSERYALTKRASNHGRVFMRGRQRMWYQVRRF